MLKYLGHTGLNIYIINIYRPAFSFFYFLHVITKKNGNYTQNLHCISTRQFCSRKRLAILSL